MTFDAPKKLPVYIYTFNIKPLATEKKEEKREKEGIKVDYI